MKITKRLTILVLTLLLIDILVSIGITGNNSPLEPPLDPESEIIINNTMLSIFDLAITYQPRIYVPEEYLNPPFETLVFETHETEKSYLLLYRTVWKDENHPFPILDFLYDIFRTWYWGSTYDIEPIIIEVAKNNAQVIGAAFETEGENDSDAFIPSHTRVNLYKVPGNTSKYQIEKKEENSTGTPVFENDTHLVFTILSWNHLSYLPLNNNSLENYHKLDDLLIPFPDHFYPAHNLARRNALTLSYSSDWMVTGLIFSSFVIVELLLITLSSTSCLQRLLMRVRDRNM